MNENQQNQPKISADQALNTVASAVNQLKLTLDEHLFLQRCLQSLNELVVLAKPTVERVEQPIRTLPKSQKVEKVLAE